MEEILDIALPLLTALAGGGLLFLFLSGAGGKKKMKMRIDRVKGVKSKVGVQELQKMSLKRQMAQESMLGSMADNISFIEQLQKRLEFAGIKLSIEKYFLLNLAIMLVVTVAIFLFLGKGILLAALIGFVLGVGLPHLYVGSKISKHKKRFLVIFPDAIDLIVRGLRAGLPVSQSMQTAAQEVSEPVAEVFREITHQIALGVPVEKAMADAGTRLKLTEFNFFLTSIILQRETGGNLAEILQNLSDVLRQRNMMFLKIKALSSEARASATIVGSLPFVVFAALSYMSPDYLTPLYEDYRGNLALLGAFASLSFGIFVMNRMTKFEI